MLKYTFKNQFPSEENEQDFYFWNPNADLHKQLFKQTCPELTLLVKTKAKL